MSKLKETSLTIEAIGNILDAGLVDADKTIPIVLADIAKSLAIIADKLCNTESEGTE